METTHMCTLALSSWKKDFFLDQMQSFSSIMLTISVLDKLTKHMLKKKRETCSDNIKVHDEQQRDNYI